MMPLSTHVLDCSICRRIAEAAVEYQRAFMPATVEELILLTQEDLNRIIDSIPHFSIPAPDFDHWISEFQTDHGPGVVRLERVSRA
jgi:hypothetical protein